MHTLFYFHSWIMDRIDLSDEKSFLVLKMLAVPGKRRYSKRFIVEGYVYHKDSRNELLLRCATRSSTEYPGLVELNNERNCIVRRQAYHGHPPDNELVHKENLRGLRITRARTTHTDFVQIFDEACEE